MRPRTLIFGLLLCCPVGVPCLAGAQLSKYPTKPVRVVIPFSPGGAIDVVTRLGTAGLSERLGQQFVVDHRPGAGSTIGAHIVAKASKDGYTLLAVSATHVISGVYYKNVPYDTVKDFSGIATTASIPFTLVVSPGTRVKAVSEFVALLKSNPGRYNYGSAGSGTATHLAAEMFRTMAGVQVVHVPFKSAGEAVTEVLGGRIEATFAPVNVVKPFVESGRLVALAVTTNKRSMIFPAVPTLGEAGLPAYTFTQWFGMVAPSGTPAPIVALLSRELEQIFKTAEARDRLASQGAELFFSGPADFDRLLRDEVARLGKLVNDAGISAP